MTPDALARLQAPLHHLVPYCLFLFFWHLWYRWIISYLVKFTVVDGHGGFVCCAGAAFERCEACAESSF